MFIINLYRYFTGYVEISVVGEFCEKLLNQLSAAKISVWDIESQNEKLCLKLSLKNFLRIRKVRGKSKLRIRILEKKGFIFLLKRYIHRAGLPIGIIFFLSTLFILSQFVWNVSVVGNVKVPKEEILSACEALGVFEGVPLKRINTQILSQKLLLECKELSWCSFNIEGSKLTVNVTEISENNNKSASNIVSDYDCIIEEILVESGIAAVKKGDAVKEGDLLVSGISNVGGINRFVEAKAIVSAQINETVSVYEDFSRENRILNGKKTKKKVLKIFGLKVPLYLGKTNGEYDSYLISENLYFMSEKLPICLYTRYFDFYDVEKINSSRTDILQRLNTEIESLIAQKAQEVQVLSRQIEENQNGITLIYNIKYKKNIGLSKNLIFDISN